MQKYFLLIFTILSFLANGQKKLPPANANLLDDKYTPKENKSTNYASTSNYRESRDFKNSVSFNPFLFTRNIVALHYERVVSEKITVQAGLGFTRGKDFIQQITAGLISSKGNIIGFNDFLNATSYYGKGPFGSVGLKFFIGEDFPFNGGYIELSFRYYSYNILASNPIPQSNASSSNNSYNGYYFENDEVFKIATTSFHVGYGFQLSSTGKVKLIHDFKFCAGFRNITTDEVAGKNVQYGSQFNSGTTYKVAYKTGNKASYPSAIFIIAYNLGFGFGK